jgi:hypothetical protein
MTMEDENSIVPPPKHTPWNKGKLIGETAAFGKARLVHSDEASVPSDISESRSMMRLPSLSKSKSEVFGQSGHCSARLLAALRAKSGCEQSQQTA